MNTWGDASRFGGPGPGRPRGKKNKATLQKEKVMDEYRQLVLHDALRLFQSQSTLAHGQTFLFRIDKIRIGKNTYKNDIPKLVTDQYEMHMYLSGLVSHANGDMEDEKDPSASYYFLTSKEPNGATIADMLDRAMGRARQVVGLEGSTPGSAIRVELEEKQYERILTEEFNRIGSAPAGTLTTGEAPHDRTEGSA